MAAGGMLMNEVGTMTGEQDCRTDTGIFRAGRDWTSFFVGMCVQWLGTREQA